MVSAMRDSKKSPLHETVETTITDVWNDSCSISELTYAIEHGAVGATTNPTIVLNVLSHEMDRWRDRIGEFITQNAAWSETDVTWKLIEEMAVEGAKLLMPVFEKTGGKKGRLSIQTNPAHYRNADAMVEQAIYFAGLAPNMQVKIPATEAGIEAIEKATAEGVNINATVSFTVPQTLAVAEAVERGLKARKDNGHDTSNMTPVCTLMVGRIDDWLRVVAKRDGVITTPANMDWAGVACIKRAYGIYRERGFQTRLLAAAYRHHMHWSELIGGDVVLTIPSGWQKKFNASDIEVKPRFDDPVDPAIINELLAKFDDFRRAYEPDGLSHAEFDTFGASVRTLRGFIGSYHDLIALIREFMLPNPDVAQ